MAHSHVEGLLDRTGSSINFEGDLQDMSELVHWGRSLVPSHLPLLFCDEGMNGEVKVTPTMTAARLLEAFHASGGQVRRGLASGALRTEVESAPVE